MLLVNGAIAVFNGMFVTTCRILCCLRGGVFCGGVCRCPDEEGNPEEGECCGDEWYTEEGECCDNEWINEDGTVAGREGTWVCCDDSNGTVAFEILVPDDPGCVASLYRCCTDGNCTVALPEECAGEVLSGSCERFGCPKACCYEDADGFVSCDTVDEFTCGGTVDEEPSETAGKGACCVKTPVGICQYTAPGGGQFGGAGGGDVTQSFTSTEDECNAESLPAGAYDISWTETSQAFVSIGYVTQSECDDQGGYWQGLGSTGCDYTGGDGDGKCRPPYDVNCCEHVVSSAASLTFRGPRKRRFPEMDACGFQVTVTVKTGQPVYVHGGLFGSPYEACTVITTFLLCNDEFHVTPAPCSGNLDNLDIEVCWDDAASGPETLRFHCCQDTTYLLGNCDCDCVTTLLYEGNGCTSNAVIQMRGDATIDASGTGPLVLTTPITHAKNCDRTLTLDGINPGHNEIPAMGNPPGGHKLAVTKTGDGTWRLTQASTFTGQMTIKFGTLLAAVGSQNSGSSGVLGSPNSGLTPIISGGWFLLEENVTYNRNLLVKVNPDTDQPPFVTLGGVHTSGISTFESGRQIRIDSGFTVNLIAATGGTVEFKGNWRDDTGGTNADADFRIGTPSSAGTVQIGGDLITTGDVSVAKGKLEIGETGYLSATQLRIGGSSAGVVLNPEAAGGSTPGQNDRIDPETEVVILGSLLDLYGLQQRLEYLQLAGGEVIDSQGGGLLRLDGTLEIYGSNGNEISADVELVSTLTVSESGDLEISGDVSGSGGLAHSGTGTLTLAGSITYTGQTSITAGTLVVEQEFAGSADISGVTFTPTTLEVAFTTTPVSAATYQLLGGSTAQTYGVGAVMLTGAGGATGTYDSATSTLTID